MIIVAGADPVNNQPVAAFLIKRAVDKGVRLVVVNDTDNGLDPFAFTNLPLADMGKALELAARAENPVVLYGASITKQALAVMEKIGDKAAFIALEEGVNTRAAVAFGLNNGFDTADIKVLYLLAGEENIKDRQILERIDKDAFVTVQASFSSPLTDKADVVLPMAIWSERTGSLTNIEGRVQTVRKALEPKGEAKPDWEILSLLARKLGRKLGGSLEEVTARAAERLK